jgi:hypothetical protein
VLNGIGQGVVAKRRDRGELSFGAGEPAPGLGTGSALARDPRIKEWRRRETIKARPGRLHAQPLSQTQLGRKFRSTVGSSAHCRASEAVT